MRQITSSNNAASKLKFKFLGIMRIRTGIHSDSDQDSLL